MEDEGPSLSQLARDKRRDTGLLSSGGADPDEGLVSPIEELDAPPAKDRAKSEAHLTRELDRTIALQRISTRLIHEKDLDALYREIVVAAMAIMRSDMGSIQVFDPGRSALYLLACENFRAESAKHWEWVAAGETTSCGKALESGERIVVPDVEECPFMGGTEDLRHYRESGMRAMQSTPLVSRDGRPTGMISTHWKTPHVPAEEDLRLFDVLARQAADLIERAQAEERRKLLVNELNHRVKNTLAIVQAIAQQTFRGSEVPADVREALEGRLEALAGAHDLLTRANWESTDLKDIVADALAVCGVKDRATVKGPPLRLAAGTAVTFAMALHELCINAIKYGSLSVDSGKVSIEWAIVADGERRFRFEWRETGGPEVATPHREGFGSRLIERALASELKGKTRLEFLKEGVAFRVDAPLPSQAPQSPS
jgi:two-component sensor histidine kinase